ncbi:MSHA biogenesis protein MshK [Simiduia sp. 21SJ11W-1]|uniref:MSHA biogenesis protein MshK n=1 Tax=Simiduia sp. 21SJ11W-1 TaxID=2909669 RepID=UPI00209CFD62|nr:MSHA biogenesis protein MshK [Simiduia sp. 21SJ11W-1]UTA46586.1 MSHA biogenesis protein MshK [Simiduia sp. 21SJ11W-1]
MRKVSMQALMVAMVVLPSTPWAAALSDPTQPLHYQPAKPVAEGWQLSSIFISQQRKRAIINGQLVGEGDRVSQARVVRIEPNFVRLQTAKGETLLRLHQQVKRANSTP